MLNFKNFLKENPEDSQDEEKLNNSFCITNNQSIENCLSSKSILWESESKENTMINHKFLDRIWKPNKSIRKKRGNKKDDFDYDKYIKQELKKLNLEGKNKREKKRIIQKIRNRMSAQRSRIRQKLTMDFLQEENQQLKFQKQKLISQIEDLLYQKRTVQSEFYEAQTKMDKEQIQVKYFRQEKKKFNFVSSKPLLFFMGFMLILCLFYQNDIQKDSMVKIGGFSYLSNFKSQYSYYFRNFNSNHLNFLSSQILRKQTRDKQLKKKSLIISQSGVSRKLNDYNLNRYMDSHTESQSFGSSELSINEKQLFISYYLKNYYLKQLNKEQ